MKNFEETHVMCIAKLSTTLCLCANLCGLMPFGTCFFKWTEFQMTPFMCRKLPLFSALNINTCCALFNGSTSMHLHAVLFFMIIQFFAPRLQRSGGTKILLLIKGCEKCQCIFDKFSPPLVFEKATRQRKHN